MRLVWPEFLGFGLVNLRHTHGMVRLLRQTRGFADFLATLKALDPAVEVRD